MKIRTKINVIKSYGFIDLMDKIINYPFDYFKNKNKKTLMLKLYENNISSKLPTLEEYNRRKDERVIVSLTSFPKRFNQLVLTLKSIILQDITPQKIIVYLGSDTKINDITSEMKKLEKYDIEYRIDQQLNIKGHKKYYYALREFKKNLVITVDDDIVFPKTMISELINCYEKNKNSVCARRVHKITKKGNRILPYNLWNFEYTRKIKPSNRLLATTGAGTLYPPFVINNLISTTFDSNEIISLCLDADDIWMKCMEIMSSIKVVYAKNLFMGAFIDVEEKSSLRFENVGKGKNDVFLNNVIEKYKINTNLFIKD